MTFKKLSVGFLLGLSFGSQAMHHGGGQPPFGNFFQQVIGVLGDPQAQVQIRAIFQGLPPEVKRELASYLAVGLANQFLTNPEVKDATTEYVKGLIATNKGKFMTWFDGARQEYSGGIVGKFLSYIDQAVGRKSFPISGDPQLGEEFGLKEWSMACWQGNVQTIQHFLTVKDYAHLLNVADGQNKALSWAAFGYIEGEAVNGVIPTIEGFRMLVGDKRIESNFLIQAGLGRIPFDEWLLYEASYSQDSEKQARLNDLKGLLHPTLSPERLDALKAVRDRKESQKRAQERAAAALQAKKFNSRSLLVGAAVMVAGLLYYNKYYKVDAAPERPTKASAAA